MDSAMVQSECWQGYLFEQFLPGLIIRYRSLNVDRRVVMTHIEFRKMNDRLENLIREAYESGVSVLQAERLAGEFLHAQLIVSRELTNLDLDARMTKTGVKALRAAVYLEECNKESKKPTEATLAAIMDTHEGTRHMQNKLDEVESERDELKRLLDVYANAHIHYRTICKGSFGG